jgi:hypothetical protein
MPWTKVSEVIWIIQSQFYMRQVSVLLVESKGRDPY